jgi:hypothetical protein
MYNWPPSLEDIPKYRGGILIPLFVLIAMIYGVYRHLKAKKAASL